MIDYIIEIAGKIFIYLLSKPGLISPMVFEVDVIGGGVCIALWLCYRLSVANQKKAPGPGSGSESTPKYSLNSYILCALEENDRPMDAYELLSWVEENSDLRVVWITEMYEKIDWLIQENLIEATTRGEKMVYRLTGRRLGEEPPVWITIIKPVLSIAFTFFLVTLAPYLIYFVIAGLYLTIKWIIGLIFF